MIVNVILVMLVCARAMCCADVSLGSRVVSSELYCAICANMQRAKAGRNMVHGYIKQRSLSLSLSLSIAPLSLPDLYNKDAYQQPPHSGISVKGFNIKIYTLIYKSIFYNPGP